MTVNFSIRPLEKGEWELLRKIRLEALQSHSGVYGSTYAREKEYTPTEWQDWLSQKGKCTFGLFDGDKLIGLTGIYTDRNDPDGKTAVLAASYIKPEYRGRGLSGLLYKTRLDWVRTQPQFEKIVVSHRADNEASRRANQAFGFRPVGTRSKTWPDGIEAEEILYELKRGEFKPG
jgi:RimJ/RimL family protein N-acetyltransferase